MPRTCAPCSQASAITRTATLVECPCEGDAVLMRQSRHPVHVGIWLAVDAGGVLHAARDIGVVFQGPADLTTHGWRIEGFYRFTGDA